MKKNFTLFKVLLVAIGLLGGVSTWAATETYTFSDHTGSFTYASSHFSYSNSNWGYMATDEWLNNRFSFEDGTTQGAHRNYWQVRTFKTDDTNFTGLNNTQSTEKRLGIHNLTDGDVIVVRWVTSKSVKFGTTNVKIEGQAEVVSEGATIVSGQRYVVSTSDETTMVEIVGPQYCCISEIQIVTSQEIANGTYYLKNKATGAYFAGGLQWNTQAITNNLGHKVGLTFQSDGTYTINSYLYNGGTSSANHFLTNALWCDGASTKWTFTKDGEGYYTISYNNTNLTAGESGTLLTLTAETGDNTKWQLLTEAEWKAENVARLDEASATNGVDATFYIASPNFNRNDDHENAKWNGSPAIGGLDGNGVASNYNAEKFNGNWNGSGFDPVFSTFDVYQSLTGLKPGAYKLTVDGFYRNGETDDRNAMLYANDYSTPLANIKSSDATTADADAGLTTNNDGYYVPNSQAEAAKAFNSGYYDNELFFVVGSDGALRIGVKNDNSVLVDWTVFDNFQLTYYGETVTATIGSTGYTTFSSSYPLDLTDIEAYYIASGGVGSDKAVLTEATGTVAAGEGLILAGTPQAVISIPVAATGSAISENLLVGCPTATDVTAPDVNAYVLVNNNGAEFQPLSGSYTNGKVTIPAGKAYLYTIANTNTHANLRIVFAGEATGIANIEAAKAKNGAMFNMAGQRVDGSYKGIVIKNGKKVWVK